MVRAADKDQSLRQAPHGSLIDRLLFHSRLSLGRGHDPLADDWPAAADSDVSYFAMAVRPE
jgi:hypothetical protein